MSIFIDVQHGIAGFAVSLTWERKASGIQHKHSVNFFQDRTVDMPETYTVTVPGVCFIYDSGEVHRYAIIVTVADKDPVSGNGKLIFSGKVREKVVISGDNGAGAFGKCLDKKFPAFHIAAVDQHVKGLLS